MVKFLIFLTCVVSASDIIAVKYRDDRSVPVLAIMTPSHGLPAKQNAARLSLAKPDPCSAILPSGDIPLLLIGNTSALDCSLHSALQTIASQRHDCVVVMFRQRPNLTAFVKDETRKVDAGDKLVLLSIATVAFDRFAMKEVGDTGFRIFVADDPWLIDPSMASIFILATVSLVVGSCWGAFQHPLLVAIRNVRNTGDKIESDAETVDKKDALMFMVLSSASLVLIYWFPAVLIYVVLFAFFMSGTSSVWLCLDAVSLHLGIHETRLNRPVFLVDATQASAERLTWLDIVHSGVGLAVMTIWAIFRNNEYGWIVQDLVGFCVIVSLLRLINLPDMQTAAIMMAGLFLYDIFWVFGSKYFTADGSSVMEAVATASGTSETMPLLLKIPKFDEFGGYSMLGYGDVVLPGLLTQFARALDKSYEMAHSTVTGTQDCSSEPSPDQDSDDSTPLLPQQLNIFPFINRATPRYFVISVFGYVVGLFFAFLAVYVTGMGQPALLYLVPCTMIPILVYAQSRGELNSIWSKLGDADFQKVE